METLRDCSDRAFEVGEVDPEMREQTQRCYNKYAYDYDNIPIIDQQLKGSYDFEQYPGIVVNENLIRGYMSKKSIITSVCDAYTQKPAACQEYDIKLSTYSYARNTSLWHFYGVIITCSLVLALAAMVVRCYMNMAVRH